MAERWVSQNGAGTQDGSSAENADAIADINTQIALAGPGGTVWLVTGTYTFALSGTPIFITTGGTAGNPVTIRGQAPTGTELRSNREDPWAGGADGDPMFRIQASYLTFQDIHFRNVGNGCLSTSVNEVGLGLTDITLIDWTATNVMRVVEFVATVDNFTMENGTATGYSKGIGRFQGDSSGGAVTNVDGDSQHIDGDPIPFGFQHLDTVHGFRYNDVHAHNHISTAQPYYNGDGFVSEEETYDIWWTDCSSNGNADAGWDIKGGTPEFPHRLTNCTVDDSKRSFRGGNVANAVLTNCTGTDPVSRGGTGNVAQIHCNAHVGTITVIGGSFTGGGAEVTVFETLNGSGILNLCGVTYSHHASAILESEGEGTQINFLDGDCTPLVGSEPETVHVSMSEMPPSITTLLASAARTSDSTVQVEVPNGTRGLVVVSNFTALAATPSVTITIRGYDPVSATTWNLLQSTAITTAAPTQNVLKVGLGFTAAANLAANEGVPKVLQVFFDHADADSITYSSAIHFLG